MGSTNLVVATKGDLLDSAEKSINLIRQILHHIEVMSDKQKIDILISIRLDVKPEEFLMIGNP
jgi:hypothetical protein